MALRNYFLCLLAIALLLSFFQSLELLVLKNENRPNPPQDQQLTQDLTRRYDEMFRKYTRTYFGRMSWKWFKAQSIQESRLDPYAKSSAGAMGLMQLMPGTYKELARELGLPPTPYDPKSNIHAGIRYNLKAFNFWTEKRSWLDQLKLMFASYNAGPGNIARAQKIVREKGLCDGNRWECIKQGLPQVTGRHSKETIQYVDKVEYYHSLLR
tara:strand:+ start:328 stop:960 length:633 start_codon:yes stop_codon:yes gene_type:complete